MHYDGSRGENFDKWKNKYDANLTNKQKEAANFYIGRGIFEEDIIYPISSIYYYILGYFPSKLWNKIDIVLNTNIIQTGLSS